MRKVLRDFYARYDVWFEIAGGLAIALLAVQELLPPWLVIALIVIRQLGAMRGMFNEKKKEGEL